MYTGGWEHMRRESWGSQAEDCDVAQSGKPPALAGLERQREEVGVTGPRARVF